MGEKYCTTLVKDGVTHSDIVKMARIDACGILGGNLWQWISSKQISGMSSKWASGLFSGALGLGGGGVRGETSVR